MRTKSFILASCFSLAMISSAFAHAHLVSSVPQSGGTVATAPTQVSIDFTEELEPKASSIRVDDTTGAQVDTGDSHTDKTNAKRLIVDLKALQPGTYKVIWKATATDTHKTNGTFTFKVGG
jgi:methionine-rich copper-binding protein CopC